MERWPPSITVALQPGGTSVVAVDSSMIAGPATASPIVSPVAVEHRSLHRPAGEDDIPLTRGPRGLPCRRRGSRTRQPPERSQADVGHLDAVLRAGMTVLPVVCHVEARPHRVHVDGSVRHRDGEDIFLPVVAEVDGPLECDGVLGDPLIQQVLAALLLKAGERGFESIALHEIPEGVERLLVVAAHVRLQHAPGGEGAGVHRHDHLADLQLLGQGSRLCRACAAEGDEGEVPRVDAALDGNGPDRVRHLGVHDVHHALRHGLGRQPERVADRGERRDCRVPIQRHCPRRRNWRRRGGRARGWRRRPWARSRPDRSMPAPAWSQRTGGRRAWRPPPPTRWSRRPRR